MTRHREKLLEKLRALRLEDPERGHIDADQALLDYIDDPEVTEAFEAIGKWYA